MTAGEAIDAALPAMLAVTAHYRALPYAEVGKALESVEASTASVPHAVAEMVLAYAVGSSVERSYARSDLFEKRRPLMDRWAAYVAGDSARVVRLHG